MQRYGLYDATRGLTTLAAAGGAGVLLWVATLVGQQTDGRFWAEMGIVAGAGLVMAISQVIGGWTKGLGLRVSPSTFLLAFLPVLVVVGWILLASQPGHGWYEGTFVRWTHDIGLTGLVHDLALWHGVLAFGFGLVFGLSFDTVPAMAPAVDVPVGSTAANEPVMAERREVGTRTPVSSGERTPTRVD
jgi:hypothetical protein